MPSQAPIGKAPAARDTRRRVCENPAVLATAADTLGAACPPPGRLQGQPAAAASPRLRPLHARCRRRAAGADRRLRTPVPLACARSPRAGR
ncbi:DUF2399 domain-containing protein [Streptomyces sp. NPDC058735]|uniref:DUF2399 domain-containing protein n=1 Tax=unclassified Streptomyces TaxID=2593676 RepID=UPI00369CB3BB